jgi:glyceraldehyde-3-phosphate dehydrogenase (NAD(P))
MIHVAVNGYGVIGRRVADAVSLQPDMKLEGVVKVKPDYKARLAGMKYPLYALDDKGLKSFENAGLSPAGTLTDLLKNADIVVDACPGGVGAKNKEIYERFGKRAVFQGGEKHEVAGFSFVAQCNFNQARGRKFVRVVSCNTTGLCRTLDTLEQKFGLEKVRVVITRRATDPDDPSKGPIDSIVLDPVELPSHHGPDVNTVLPNVNIFTMALMVPCTHMHIHSVIATLKEKNVTEDKVIKTFEEAPRIMLVSSSEGFNSTSQVVDFSREMLRPRNDLYEVVLWRDSFKVIGNELFFYMGIHQEAIVIPENVDAIRALDGGYTKEDSMKLTNRTLGIAH